MVRFDSKSVYPGVFIVILICGCLLTCGGDKKEEEAPPVKTDEGEAVPAKVNGSEALTLDYSSHPPPKGIQWVTNNDDPVIRSPEAKKGGVMNDFKLLFPMTFRTVGPDSNTSVRSLFLGNMMALVGLHPETERLTPVLASHWAFDDDGKTIYFKLHEKARWSDGVPVTADDFIFALEMMRSKHIHAPFYNDHFTKHYDKIIKYDDRTFAIVSPKPYPDLWYYLNMTPRPKHFYKTIDENWVKKYNWAKEPNTGPYFLKDFKKGKYLIFERKKDWWAGDLRYYKRRFNVDRIKYTVIRDYNVAFEHFKKGKLDAFEADRPSIWHKKAKGELFDKGYIHKRWFYNDTRRTSYGLHLNQDKEIFKDRRVRLALAHAINFEKLNNQVLMGDYERLHNVAAGFGEWTDKTIRARTFDIGKTEEYMTGAGWKRGADGIWEKEGWRYSVTLTYGKPGVTPRMVVLKEEAKKAGIELNLELLDTSAWYKKSVEKKHEITYVGFSGSNLRPSPWQSFHSDNAHKPQTNNITNTDDPEMDRLIDRYRDSLDNEERILLARRIQRRVHEIGAWIPLQQVPFVRHLYWRWMKLPDVPGSRKSTDLFEPFEASESVDSGLFWIDEEAKKETLEAMKEGRSFEPVVIVDKTHKSK